MKLSKVGSKANPEKLHNRLCSTSFTSLLSINFMISPFVQIPCYSEITYLMSIFFSMFQICFTEGTENVVLAALLRHMKVLSIQDIKKLSVRGLVMTQS